MVIVSGLQIFLALSSTFLVIPVSFLACSFSFLKTKYSLSRCGFMSNFNLICLTIFVSDRNFSCFVPSENTQFFFPTECQYLSAVQCLDFSGCLLLAQCQSIPHILESSLWNISLETTGW